MKGIGLFLITYNRLHYLKQSLKALEDNNWGGADYIGIVDDCSTDGTVEYIEDYIKDNPHVQFIKKESNSGVANSKNMALEAMYNANCTHLFTIEDDILMQDSKACIKYISYAFMKEVYHMNFALHGPANIGRKGSMMWKGREICIYPNVTGAFTYINKICIKLIGYYDEEFGNCMDHPYYTYLVSKAGLHPPFWHFVDHPDSVEMFKEISGSIQGTSIPMEGRHASFEKARNLWIKKQGSWITDYPRNLK